MRRISVFVRIVRRRILTNGRKAEGVPMTFMKRAALSAAVLMASTSAFADDRQAVLENYADIALAGYEDSLTTARTLDSAIDALIANPSEQSLKAARSAWIDARVPYQQTEAFRFGNAIVDDWEGRVNAWPLDEGLIDYVDASYGTISDENGLYTANVIANPKLKVGGKEVDATSITPALLSGTLHEADSVEANVATGYHAIEFLLWGQDTNGTGAGAGNRPYTDFDVKNCTGGNCDRRAAYLKAASTLMIADLEEMVANWQDGGAARKEVTGGDAAAGVARILTGMGSLSYGELAGERMKLGLLLHDPEEEHDCFSDNTHNSHYYDAMGIRNVYTGTYKRVDGSTVSGPSLSSLVAKADASVDAALRKGLDETMSAMGAMKARAESGESYDQMIGQGNDAGNAVVQAAIDGLVAQTREIERAVAALGLGGIEIEGSDSLDNVDAVFK
jgi:putative iron-regulated protein